MDRELKRIEEEKKVDFKFYIQAQQRKMEHSMIEDSLNDRDFGKQPFKPRH